MTAADESAALDELSECRTAIAEIDRGIIAFLANRVALARRTKTLKSAVGLPLLDPQREAEVIRGAVAAARELNLPEEPVRAIFWQVVGLSRRAQESGA